MLELKEVCFTIQKDGEPVNLVNHASFDVPRGHFMAIVGPSGCGKTTLLKTIAGLNPESGGSLWWDGRNLSEEGDLEPGEIGYSSLSTETYSIQQELLPSATYYFRVRAQNGRTETVSEISSFTMPGAQNLVLLADIFPTTPLPDDQTTVIDFGTTPLGVVVSQGFTLTNDGEWPLLVSSLSVSTG